MKKTLFLLGTVPVALVAAALLFNTTSSEDGVYRSRTSSNIHQPNTVAEGMLDHYFKLRGNYTQEDYLRVMAEMEALPQNRATVSWIDHGPDNVGGRTRAILVDRNDINHIYAGSVSGGLFESFNRANYWEQVTEFSENLAISSMCQTVDGTIYIATGHSAETSTGSQNAYDTGGNGNGIYKRESNGTFTQITGSQSFSYINEVVCDTLSNLVWFATNSGLRQYDPVNNVTNTITNGLTPGACNALSISPDGQVIVCAMSGGKTNVSVDGGVTFNDVSGNGTGKIEAGAGRVEYAISHEKNSNGLYSIYASCANSFLVGIWMSQDNGLTWTEIAPANNQQPGSFAPFTTGGGSSGQGTYDNIISVQKGNPNKIFLGGIDLYSWATTGNWTQLSQWFLPIQASHYVHADNHELVWDKQGRLYIGNDGGIAFSDDGGQTFHPANRGYNVTQFYTVGASAHGDVIGGSQDNGTQANYHDNSTWHEFDEVGGGDGFSADISFINRNIIFTSVYHSGIGRSPDRGGNVSSFVPAEFGPVGTNSLGCTPGASDGSGCGQFFTNFEIWENPNDTNSKDSVSYIPGKAYTAGEVIDVPSMTSQTFIKYVTPQNVIFSDTVNYNPAVIGKDTIITSAIPSNDYNLSVFNWSLVYGAPGVSAGDSIYLTSLDTTVEVLNVYTINHYYGTNPLAPGDTLDMANDSIAFGIAWDTLRVQDPYQSWFAIGLGGGEGIWMTRNALRFSAPTNAWFKVNHTSLGGGGNEVSAMEFSRDGNNLFVGTWSGKLFRLSGFGDVYSPVKDEDTLIDVNNVTNIANLQTTWTQIGNFGAPVTGIAVEGDLTHVVVTLGLYSTSANGKVQETTDAMGSSPAWSNMGLSNNLPCYSAVIDRDNPNVVVVGTDMGTYVTENGGGLWENCSGGFGNSPVFDMKQNWRTYNEGCYRPGEIYIGVHGRGIWSSEAYLGTPTQQDNLATSKFIPNINVYPNPMTDQGTIAFNLESSSNVVVSIYSLSGQLVMEMNETNLSPGQNNISFGVADLPKGTYIVRLVAGDKIETSKFIKH